MQVKPSTLHIDDGDADPLAEDDTTDRSHLFQNAIPIPALLHIFDNLAAQVGDNLVWFDTFLGQLQSACAVLCQPEGKDRFMKSLLRRGLHHIAPLFQKNFERYIDWRWSSLIKTLHWLLPLENALRLHWDDAEFGRVPAPRGPASPPDPPILMALLGGGVASPPGTPQYGFARYGSLRPPLIDG